MKDKICKACGIKFSPHKPMQKVCGIECSLKYATRINREKREKERRAKDRQKKESLKTKSELLKEVQPIFNQWIRLRDTIPVDKPCISCGRHHKGQYHAGHFKTVGGNPELRFCEAQVFKQCSPCNLHLSGNLEGFRKGILEREGQERLDWIDGPHEMPHWTREELADLKKKYRQKIKDLEAYFPELMSK